MNTVAIPTVLRAKLLTIVLSIATPAIAASEDLVNTPLQNSMNSPKSSTVIDFNDHNLDLWQERSFVGNSKYEIIDESGVRVLKASTAGKASVLYREDTIELSETPMLNWWWKVDSVFDNPEEQTKMGDDFPARIYVVAQIGFAPWDSLSLNYVWASESENGSSWVSPYTDKSVMLALQSGSEKQGEWILESRNILQDFATYFGVEISRINALAVMVDGDNGGHSGTAYFGGIGFTEY